MIDRDKRTVMIVGATSDIARALAHTYAQHGADLQLAARDHERLQDDAHDIQIRYNVWVTLHELDILELETFDGFVDGLDPLPDVVICAVGLLGDQAKDQTDVHAQHIVMVTNYVGPSCLMGVFADRFEKRESGKIIGISSVAGDRGRATNYVYGSGKSSFSAYLSGLRNRLSCKNIPVLTIKPGFVRTSMTQNLSIPFFLSTTPTRIAHAIRRADAKNKNTLYYPFYWKFIMYIIIFIPEPVFKRLSI